MKHRIVGILSAALMLLSMSVPALAAAPPSPSIYPAEVRASEENGVARLEKVYYLTTRDDPAAIPTEDFDREGRHYTLLDVLKTDMSETDVKDYAEVITLESATKDVGEIIKTLEPELEVVTEDGYNGILKPDYTTITAEAAGYKTSSWTVSASRTYPNLSDADIALLPKSIEDNGRTLTLADVDWQDASTDYVDGDQPQSHRLHGDGGLHGRGQQDELRYRCLHRRVFRHRQRRKPCYGYGEPGERGAFHQGVSAADSRGCHRAGRCRLLRAQVVQALHQ